MLHDLCTAFIYLALRFECCTKHEYDIEWNNLTHENYCFFHSCRTMYCKAICYFWNRCFFFSHSLKHLYVRIFLNCTRFIIHSYDQFSKSNSFSYPTHCFPIDLWSKGLLNFFDAKSIQYTTPMHANHSTFSHISWRDEWLKFIYWLECFYFHCIYAFDNMKWNAFGIFIAEMVDVSLQVCIIDNSSICWHYRFCVYMCKCIYIIFFLSHSALFYIFLLLYYWLLCVPFVFI